MNSSSLPPWPFKGWDQLLDQHISIIVLMHHGLSRILHSGKEGLRF